MTDTIFAAIKTKLALVQVSEQRYVADIQAKIAEHDNTMRELTVKLKRLKLSQSTALEEYLEGKIDKSELQSRKAKTASMIQETEEQLMFIAATR